MRKHAFRTTSAAARGPSDYISEHLGTGPVVKERFFGGSSWSSQYLYETEHGASYFVKTAMGTGSADMFQGEALGLRAMADTQTIRIPKVLHVGPMPDGRGSFIVMEFLSMSGSPSLEDLGRQLGRMHAATPVDPDAAAGRFGFPVNNTIGGTPQPNGWMDSWVDFYRDQRLAHQLQLAGDARLSKLGDKLLPKLDIFFQDVADDIRPCVLHGDLWSGNIGAVGGQPTVFDPAVYYGHSEAEWGMSWCAGFTDSFWRGYFSIMPKAPGFDKRRPLYTLYHYLNHYNLFGGGYYNTSLRIMEGLVAQL